MKHYVKPECKHGCRFLMITPSLWLCPHASYGEATYQMGAVAEGRRILERAGGYDVVLARLVKEEERKQRARNKRDQDRGSSPAVVRYD